MKSLFFSRGKESYEPNLIFAYLWEIVYVMHTTFYTYKISNSVVNK